MQYQRLVAERIAPQARVAVAGKDNAALNAGDTARAAPPPAAPAAVLTGGQGYSTTCIACHAPGVPAHRSLVAKERGDRAPGKAWERSEEGRVGEEGRSRWGPDHLKKKK